MSDEPHFTSARQDGRVRLHLDGAWTLEAGRTIERTADALVAAARGAESAEMDLQEVTRLDTGGAWLIDRARASIEAAGAAVHLAGASERHRTLLKEAGWRPFSTPPRPRPHVVRDLLADVGVAVVSAGRDLAHGVTFLGASVVAVGRALLNPRDLRATSIFYHLESFALRSTPIILLINFLVGCIVAQQGIFQLRTFGAETFAVDLIGILILRELGVLLTAIMVAGRTGSAITAELGSMKMREEIDALTVMGLSPMQTLVAPRLIALIVGLPLLTFLADMAAIAGGMVVAWVYGGLSPEGFLARLQVAIGLNTFLVGMIKAPFMALVIGLIASMEGMATQGSAESLGRQVTASVVKSIFMVIVVDGLFAMFFAAINY